MRNHFAFVALALAAIAALAPPSQAQTPIVLPGEVIISEFRFRGPGGTEDEYVELYNNTDRDITVQSTNDGYTPDGGRVGTCLLAKAAAFTSRTAP